MEVGRAIANETRVGTGPLRSKKRVVDRQRCHHGEGGKVVRRLLVSLGQGLSGTLGCVEQEIRDQAAGRLIKSSRNQGAPPKTGGKGFKVEGRQCTDELLEEISVVVTPPKSVLFVVPAGTAAQCTQRGDCTRPAICRRSAVQDAPVRTAGP